ncbi:NAD(P)/FAD-dependent oxidoreductase [Couchioplanes azureus]|uniref:NAD(P)/FAD-dependent oxidoreductase n=1 Tax=Couchioplanes caeruleus TaxID=56438 RepID=UPI0016714E16|nr:FAD-binding oxidoreductase [Couchioplanes caeruleus]GGQ65181.1 FAD-dependent oxidoreductase [Couchioplanes caeruleus subsp. azureus]
MNTGAAEVVVVGGGVVGVSVLYHLALAGCRSAVLLERAELGSGSTGAAAGGFRAQFSDPLNIAVALDSNAVFRRFRDTFGVDIGLREVGYLFLLRESDVAAFRSSTAVQRAAGVPVQWLEPREAARLVPGLATDDLAAATYCPTDGLATPQAVVAGYAAAARGLGATIEQGRTVRAILTGAGRVTGVRTDSGDLHAPTVILTAGVWSPALAATAGLALPVTPQRRYVYFADAPPAIGPDCPLTIDFATSLYFHGERTGLIMGGPWPTAEELAEPAVRRLPALADVGIRSQWSGLYEMSPDHNAVVGACSTPAGLLYATGFSGHGFQQAPTVGRCLAALALGLAPPLDLSALSVQRFGAAAARPELNLV